MTRLWRRKARLSVGRPGEDLIPFPEDLKIVFNITKTIDAEPNKASIKIYNLKRSNRNFIALKGNVIKLELKYIAASYTEEFLGEARFVQSKLEKADMATMIECGDGDTAFNSILLNETIGPGADGVSVQQIFARMKSIFTTEMAEKFGSAGGNDSSVDSDYDSIIERVSNEATSIINGLLKPSSGKFRKGKTLKGTFGNIMSELSERVGVDFFINNQTMYVLEKDKVLDLPPLIFTPDTGLIGVPTKLEDGGLQIETLIVPGLLIGRQVVVESREVNGQLDWKMTRLNLNGDNRGPNWKATIDLALIGATERFEALGPPVPA